MSTFRSNLANAFTARSIPYLTFGARSCWNASLHTATGLWILAISRQANDAIALTCTSISVEILVRRAIQDLATRASTNRIWIVYVKRIDLFAFVAALYALAGASIDIVVGKRTPAGETA